jgi:hypothetical protein
LTADVLVLVLLLVLLLLVVIGAKTHPSKGSGAGLKGARRAMTILSWNCRGSGESLNNSKMAHLA